MTLEKKISFLEEENKQLREENKKLREEKGKIKEEVCFFKNQEYILKKDYEVEKLKEENRSLQCQLVDQEKEIDLKTNHIEYLDSLVKRVMGRKIEDWYKNEVK